MEIKFRNQQNQIKNVAKELLICFLTSVVFLTICSKSSPLYPFNDWGDANCYLTVGKAMLEGVVPYRDLVEQKGPLLYMLHAVAALISNNTFLGVYVIEIIASTMFLFLCLKTIHLYTNKPSWIWLPVIAGIVYSSTCFSHGDSAEEFCLPLLAYCLYCGLKSIEKNTSITNIEGFLIGITSACVLWIKFTMLGFYFGWFIAYAIIQIHKKRTKTLWKTIVSIVFGVATTSLSILTYFALNDALNDLWQVYFYNNLFLYSNIDTETTGSIFLNLRTGMLHTIITNGASLSLFIISMLFCIKQKQTTKIIFLLSSFIGLFVLVYIGGRGYIYYSLCLSVFVPAGAAEIQVLLNKILENCKIKNTYSYVLSAVLLCVSVFAAYSASDNTYMLKYEKNDLPQYQFAEIINKQENPTLLNYGFLDGGYYTTTRIIPSCKYFCLLNIPLKEMYDTQNNYIEDGLVEFVVTRDMQLNNSNYKCIAQSSYLYEGTKKTDYLYQLYKGVN